MKVAVRNPGLQVTLVKAVSRTTLDGLTPVSSRFSGAKPTIDITEYIGERDSVRVSKSVRAAAGSFSFTMTEQLYYDGQTNYGDSLYGLIEPMDSIVIRMTGDTYKQNASGGDGNIPIRMRGFVSRVRYAEGVDAEGHPQRVIMISGQDYGKILQMIQIFYMPGISSSDAAYMTQFPFFAQYGAGNNIMAADAFMQQIFDDVVNPYISNIGSQSQNQTYLPHIATDIIVNGGTVSPYGTGGFQQGTIYDLIKSFGDIGSWNEFFIEDRQDAPYAVYRPNPFNAVDGTPIFTFPDGKFPITTKIGREDVIGLEAGRSDENVANYFWVSGERFVMNYDGTLRAFAVQSSASGESPYVTDYQNVDPTLYGVKKMFEQTNQGGSAEDSNGNGLPDGADRNNNKADYIQWITQRRKDLISQNKDNILFEDGSLRLKGNEKIKAGTYVNYEHGDMVSSYYVHSVDDFFQPYGTYTMTVNFDRGTNFINRIQRNAARDSPYLGELYDPIT